MANEQPILIGFDGSDGSARAIRATAELFPKAHVRIVHVWHMPNLYTAGYAGAPALPTDVLDDVRKAAEDQANETLEHGKDLAGQVGLETEGVAYVTSATPWRQLLGSAQDAKAKLIVVGSRGRGGVKSLVLGSTSQALAHHSRLPLLIVPDRSEE
jgi:nucleotide-binding universal stress UspA family protein